MKPGGLLWAGLLIFAVELPAAASDSVESVRSEESFTIHDSWTGRDKSRHFITSALLVCAGSAGVRSLDRSRSESLNWGVGFSFSMGLAKEVHDKRQPGNHFCWKDLTADLLGIVFGIWIMEHW